jgi:hypothetical protein
MDNIIKTSGTTEQFKLNSGGSISFPYAVRGIVKDNVDTIRTGRLRVYIDDFGASNPDDSDAWVTVSYLSPFYGSVQNNSAANPSQDTSYGAFAQNPHAYGFWATSPDIGSEVICMFLYGKKDFGYYIGCIPQPGLTHMVPAIGSTDNIIANNEEAGSYGGAKKLPVIEINDKSDKVSNDPQFNDQPRPVHTVIAAQLWQQGLIRDDIRGTISSSSSRESPSNVFGMSTPGRPIYLGVSGENDVQQTTGLESSTNTQAKVIARQGGHSIVLDDGNKLGQNNLMRLRTSGGHQITMSDDGQTLFVIHANGQSYVELGKEGTVDIYATNSFNVRTKGDINFHADNNINLNAKKKLNIYAEEINVNSDKNTNIRVGENFSQNTLGDHTVKVDKGMSMHSVSKASYRSDAETYINGSRVNLNTGFSGLVPKKINPLPIVTHTDTLFDKTKGWIPAPAVLTSITSRSPAHYPWVNANLGVDVKVDDSADANFPTGAPTNVSRANANTPSAPPKTTTPAVASTAPANKEVSPTMNKNTTSTMVSQSAVNAGTDPTKSTVVNGTGSGVVTDLDGTKKAILGKLAHTPDQLEQGGFIKPGSAQLVNSLVAGNKTIDQAMPTNIWTGKDGVTTVNSYVNNKDAQVTNQVEMLKIGIAGLKDKGVITGNESSTQIAGVVTAAATLGVVNTVNYINGSTNGTTNQLLTSPNATKLTGAVSAEIASGNFAANMADKVTSPAGSMLGSIKSTATGVVDSVKGAAASVFGSIKEGYTKLKGGVPQNLTKLNAENQVKNDPANDPYDPTKDPTLTDGQKAAAASPAKKVTLADIAAGVSAVSSIVPNTNVGMLAGGVTAISNLVTNSKDKTINVSGSNVGNSISSTISSISSKVPGVPSAPPSITKAGLSAAALSGLSLSQSASLNSALQSISSGGPQSLQMPTIAENTINKVGLASQTTALLGDNRIPTPPTVNGQFKSPPADLVKRYDEAKAELQKQEDLLWDLKKKLYDDKKKWGVDSAEALAAEEQVKVCRQRIEELKAEKTSLTNQMLAA